MSQVTFRKQLFSQPLLYSYAGMCQGARQMAFFEFVKKSLSLAVVLQRKRRFGLLEHFTQRIVFVYPGLVSDFLKRIGEVNTHLYPSGTLLSTRLL